MKKNNKNNKKKIEFIKSKINRFLTPEGYQIPN